MKTLFLKSLALLLLLMLSANMWAETSEYCKYIHDAGENQPATTWETYANGNVVITMSNVEGSATNAKFRNGGFEGGIGAWVVLSGDEFATSEPAGNYFTRQETSSTVFTMKKKADVSLPTPCKLRFQNSAFSWTCDEKATAWHSNCVFEYTYGTLCTPFDAPTNIAISATGRLTFECEQYDGEVANTYEARIYKAGVLVHSQDVVSNDVLNFVPDETTTYQVKVIAFSGNYASPESAAYDWAVEAGHVYGKSKYCNWLWNSTANEGWPAFFTWETLPNGNIQVTIAPNGDQGAGVTEFREALRLGGLTVGTEAGSEYFTSSYDKDVATLSLIPGKSIPNGTLIKFNTTLPYKTGTHTNAWPTIRFDYIYGTKCTAADAVDPVITTFEKVSATVDGMTFHVVASDVDDEGTPNELTYKISGNNGFAEQTVVLDGEGNFTISGLMKNVHHSFTLTAIDPSGNETTKDLENVDTEFDAGYNLALNMPCTGGYCQFSNHTPEDDAKYHKRANDGNRDNSYSAYGAPEGEAWWQVDLGTIYNLNRIDIYYASDYSDNYQILGSFDGSEWFTMASDAATAEGLKSTALSGAARYVKVFSVKRNVVFKEIEIFGTGFGAADSKVPVITTFEAVSTDATSVELHIVASDVNDKDELQPVTYTIAGNNGFAEQAIVLDDEGNVLISGLIKNKKSYVFNVVATDLAGNVSEERTVRVELPFDAEYDLGENATAETVWAGATEGENTAIKAVRESGRWGNFGKLTGSDEEKIAANWWTIELDTITEISYLSIDFSTARKFDLQATFDGKDKVDAGTATWFTVYRQTTAGNLELTTPNFAARCIRVQATTTEFMSINRFVVKGSNRATTDDVAPQVTVTEVSKTTNTATLKIVAADEDDAHVAHAVKSIAISSDNGFTTIENAVLDGEGNITLNDLKDNTTYTFHVLVTDRVGLTASQDITVRVLYNPAVNLALASNGATAEAGSWEGAPDGTAHNPSKAIDGKAATEGVNNTYWGTWGCGNYESSNTFTLTLAASYNINSIVIKTAGFDGITEHNITLSYSADKISWTPFATNYTLVANETNTIPVVISAKYIRLTSSTNHMITIKEFEVYGLGYDDGDTEKPVITDAALVGEATDESAVVSVEATDNIGVYGLRFVDEANAYNVTFDYVHGENLTLEGLAPGTTYHFNIYALDRAGNVSEAHALAPFTTVGNTNIPNTPAPTPKQASQDVLSIYSDSYASAVKDGFSWNVFNGAGTSSATHLNIAGNNYTIYTVGGGNQVGIGHYVVGSSQLNGAAGHTVGENKGLNISDYKFLHVDVWTTESWNLTITLNDPTLANNIQLHDGWNAIDLPITSFLADYDGIDDDNDIAHNLRWMKFTNAAGHTLAIDNIFFWNKDGITLHQDDSEQDGSHKNAQLLSDNNARVLDVTLDRTFIADGYWYTLCLPFDLSAEQLAEAYGAGYDLRYLASSYMKSSDLLYLNFEKVTELQAGMPYMFKPTGNSDEVYGPTVFSNVKIDAKTPVQATSVATMTGYYSPMIVPQTDYVLGTDDYLYHTDGTASNAFRCYFTLNPPTSAPVRARVVFGPQVATDLEDVEGETIHGEFQKLLINGQLYIIREGKMYNVQGILVK